MQSKYNEIGFISFLCVHCISLGAIQKQNTIRFRQGSDDKAASDTLKKFVSLDPVRDLFEEIKKILRDVVRPEVQTLYGGKADLLRQGKLFSRKIVLRIFFHIF